MATDLEPKWLRTLRNGMTVGAPFSQVSPGRPGSPVRAAIKRHRALRDNKADRRKAMHVAREQQIHKGGGVGIPATNRRPATRRAWEGLRLEPKWLRTLSQNGYGRYVTA
mmetsp:Transcript_10251/g.7849  ORF Transcript_10251/g.7849 Transcript_10251/m.7849 type:complete len:110 (-) Transcript_10251:68-397(-)